MKSLNAETQGTQRKIKKIGGRKRREQQQKGQEAGGRDGNATTARV
jgi:hypothetical protein